jgi:hypothetical protein
MKVNAKVVANEREVPRIDLLKPRYEIGGEQWFVQFFVIAVRRQYAASQLTALPCTPPACRLQSQKSAKIQKDANGKRPDYGQTLARFVAKLSRIHVLRSGKRVNLDMLSTLLATSRTSAMFGRRT